MNKRIHRVSNLVLTVIVVLSASGCWQRKSENDTGRTILEAGNQIPKNMAGWTAVKLQEPKLIKPAGEESAVYARLGVDQVVPYDMNDWWAMTPKFFSAASGIELKQFSGDASEHWEMRHRRRVPKEVDGWIGVPGTAPSIRKDEVKKYKAFAQLKANHLIPKDMDGWVAVPRSNFVNLVSAYQIKTGSVPRGNKKPADTQDEPTTHENGSKSPKAQMIKP